MSNITNFFKGFMTENSNQTPTPKVTTTMKKTSKSLYDNEDKIKISGNFSFFFDFKVIGKSIFQNLVITAAGYTFNQYKEKEVIPLKYIWKRVNGQSTRYMEEINSNSYIPTAEDIGHIIELEAFSMDQNSEVAYASYGPITLDDDMKNTLELLLSAGGTKFSCFKYNIKENEKDRDKEIIVYINSNEFKLTETFFDGNEKLIEQVKYHSLNPRIKLHPFDTKRLTLTVYEYNIDNNSNKSCNSTELISEKVKNEYHLVAMSKQCRELIYLLIQCFLIDEKLKNNKLFNSINYNYLNFDSKIGVLDLVSELKALREENSILLSNNSILEKDNVNLKREMADLEMDTQITLQAIKSSHYFNIDSTTPGNNQVYNGNTLNNNVGVTTNTNKVINNNTSNFSNDNFNSLRKKFDQLSLDYATLLSKEKATKENISKLNLDSEISKNLIESLKTEITVFKERNTSIINEIASLEKKSKYLQENLTLSQKEVNSLKAENEELMKIKKQFEEFKILNIDGTKSSKEFIELKQCFDKIEKINKTLTHEKDQLMNIKNVLQSQKDTLSKEYEKIRKEKADFETITIKNKSENESLRLRFEEYEQKIKIMSQIESDLKKEITNLKTKYDVLEIQFNTFKSTANINNDKGHFLSDDEYEEFDNLRREKDEVEALILKLQSNDLAKQKEIDELKMMIANLKN